MRRLTLIIKLVFVLFLLASWPANTSAKPQRLFNVPFTHVAQNERVGAILAEFARVQGYQALVSPALTGEVNGTFEQTDPYAFLQSMEAAYQVRWFRQGKTLHFYAQTETQQAFLTPTTVSAKALLKMFSDAGILSSQLPVKLLQAQRVLFVQGPGYYIDQLRQAMLSFEQAQANRIVMRVFPLKHAWAEDKEISSSSDSVITVPGVASILQAMVTGGQAQSTVTHLASPQQGLLGHGLASEKPGAQGGAGGAGGGSSGEAKASQPVKIIADPRVNAIIVNDAEYRMDYYARVIQDLDRPVLLVEIHAAIVDINSNFQRELGVNFQASVGAGKHWTIGGTEGGAQAAGSLPTMGAEASSGLSFSTLYTRGTDFFLSRVRALESDGVARMLGKPSVLTLDNVQASLENTSTYYVRVSGYQATDLFKINTGTILKVTPHIIPGRVLPDKTVLPDAIKLIVTVQDTPNDDSSTFTMNDTTPQPVRQTVINTQAIVAEGQSLLIAGLYNERQSEGTSGVPGLKNIPLLGRLFGSSDDKHTRMERLFLITPRIVDMREAPPIPRRVDDPRFSRTATQANYEERVPRAQPIGGCTRRRLDYSYAPDTPPRFGDVQNPTPIGKPGIPKTELKPVQNVTVKPDVKQLPAQNVAPKPKAKP